MEEENFDDLIDPEMREQLEFLNREDDREEYEMYDFENEMYGEEDIDIDRPATYKEKQAVGAGEIGIGMGAFDKRIGKTEEDIASQKISIVLEEGTYDFLNDANKKGIKKRLLNYKNFTVGNVPAMVAASTWIELNPKKDLPKDNFDEFCKKIGKDVNQLDILRYIRSIKANFS